MSERVVRLEAEVSRKANTAARNPSALWVTLPLYVLDGACLVLSALLAYHVRFRLLSYYGPYSAEFYQRVAVVAVPLWWTVFALYHLYDPSCLFGGLQEYAGVFNASSAALLCLVLFSFLDRGTQYEISRGWLAIMWVVAVATISAARFGYRRAVYRMRERGLFVGRALVIGTNEEARAVLAQLRRSPSASMRAVGVIATSFGSRTDSLLEGVPVLGGLGELRELINRHSVTELIIIPTALTRDELLALYRDWGTDTRVRLLLSSGLYELFTTGVQVRETALIPLVELNRTRITGLDALLKTVLDYIGASFGLVLLGLAFPLVALAIRLDSPGPVIYRRRVVGLHGREFYAYKFRTMIRDADTYLDMHPELREEWARNGKLQHDPRVTRVGRFLRRYSLDELPQVINVLRGQMSLVGPRMITPSELIHFGPWQYNLLIVKPGMTGLWQVSGRAELPYAQRVQLDMRYIREYTIWLDLQILLTTLIAVIRGRGAC